MNEPTSPPDPRDELASLVASARALLEQYEDSGAMGLACDPAIAAAFLDGAPLPAPRASAAAIPATQAAVSRPAQPARAPTPEIAPHPAPPSEAAPQRFAPPAEQRFVPPAEQRFVPPSAPAERPRATSPEARVEPRAPAPREEARDARPAPIAARTQGPNEVARVQAPQATRPAPIDAGPETDDRRMRLAVLAEEVRPCTKCPLCEARTQTVFARGNPFAELCFVGEGPGADEDAQGEPFVGRAGQLLDKMITAMGYRRDDVYICNIVKCRPPNNRKPEPSEMEACFPYLRDQLALVKPKAIVALGGTAVTGLTGSTEGITRLRGKWKLYKGTILIMPTFHPAYLLRDPSKKREAWHDLQEVMKHLGKAPPAARDRGDE